MAEVVKCESSISRVVRIQCLHKQFKHNWHFEMMNNHQFIRVCAANAMIMRRLIDIISSCRCTDEEEDGLT